MMEGMDEMEGSEMDGQDAKEALGEKGFEKAMMHLNALKSLCGSKGLDLEEFVESYASDEAPGDEMGAEDSGESEGADEGKKLAIILALKKKNGMA